MENKSKVGNRKSKVSSRFSLRLSPSAFLLPGCCALAAHSADAQQYPGRPVRLVLGFAPGGASDTLARVIATRLSEEGDQGIRREAGVTSDE